MYDVGIFLSCMTHGQVTDDGRARFSGISKPRGKVVPGGSKATVLVMHSPGSKRLIESSFEALILETRS